MHHSKSLAIAACAIGFTAGCQAQTPATAQAAAPEAAAAVVSADAQPPVLTTLTPSALPRNTNASANAMGKLLREGAQYILYSSDPPVTLELPREQVYLTGQHSKEVMAYVKKHGCIPLENSENLETSNLVTVCLENGSMVMRTLDGLAYVAVKQTLSAADSSRIELPPPEKLALPANISGESDDGEGDEGGPQRLSIIALPQAGDGINGYRIAEYLVLPLPSKWLADTPLVDFAAGAGCRLLNPFAAPHEEYALCYIDDKLTLVPEAQLEQIAQQKKLEADSESEVLPDEEEPE